MQSKLESQQSNALQKLEQAYQNLQLNEQTFTTKDILKQVKQKRKQNKTKLNEDQKLCFPQVNEQTEQKQKVTCSAGSSPITNNLSPFVQSQSVKFMVLQSVGHMLPNSNLDSEDPSLSSDAMFINPLVCGVADGVGQWKNFQINPKKFAEQLLEKTCNSVLNFFQDYQILEQNQQFRQEIGKLIGNEAISKAYKQVTYAGSSTIITYFILGNVLQINYIGDSQLMVVRPTKRNTFAYIYRSKPNQYGFNQPCQLICWPNQEFIEQLGKKNQKLAAELTKLINASPGNNMLESVRNAVPLKENDIIICGTDGFFDNISDEDIIQLMKENYQLSLEQLADLLCTTAYQLSMEVEYDSPFAKESRKHGINHIGGKQDDITVLISRVVSI